MKRTLTVLTSLVAWLSASPAGALTVDGAPFDQLWLEADAVVHATVIATDARRATGDRRVSTAVTLTVWQSPKPAGRGEIGERLVIELPGGSDGHLRTVAPGVPQLDPGDEVLLLLERRGGRWLPLGYRLGVFFIGPGGRLYAPGLDGTPSALARPELAWLERALAAGSPR